jgi:hypothetical protein
MGRGEVRGGLKIHRMLVKTFLAGPPRRASLRTTGYLAAFVGSMMADIAWSVVGVGWAVGRGGEGTTRRGERSVVVTCAKEAEIEETKWK